MILEIIMLFLILFAFVYNEYRLSKIEERMEHTNSLFPSQTVEQPQKVVRHNRILEAITKNSRK